MLGDHPLDVLPGGGGIGRQHQQARLVQAQLGARAANIVAAPVEVVGERRVAVQPPPVGMAAAVVGVVGIAGADHPQQRHEHERAEQHQRQRAAARERGAGGLGRAHRRKSASANSA
jgi:hypothetical protein